MNMNNYLLGFDIGGTKCAAVIGKKSSCNSMKVVDRVQFATTEFNTSFECIDFYVETIKKMMVENDIHISSVKGLGVSCGGPLDSRLGIIKSPPNLPGWDDIHIVDILSRQFNCPVHLQNDANACALAEWKFGAGIGTDNMIFLTFGTGMGAGMILNGQLYTGACDMAGECGHIRLADDGPLGYGKSGSFEGFCSGGGIARQARKKVLEYQQQGKEVSWGNDLNSINAKTVAEAANAGDELALNIYTECGKYLGRGLAILIDLLNPEVIVIGSIFARSEELLRNAMSQAIEHETLLLSQNACRIVPAQLGESTGDIACLAIVENNHRYRGKLT
jgi:glucokinase